ncbi:immunoglobulin superfamily DCC subclass member 3 [Trichechus manatus latirostris]|uniref:immunoglobulin superfamily DCC subclass member 3 n=1 Tax=Trichechus manatus latirostris TaxID=127582 RepID=UPI0002C46136|nr:immunoglobulin superfamily DCC subclass member 3 [Trichechus manatus latirostris]
MGRGLLLLLLQDWGGCHAQGATVTSPRWLSLQAALQAPSWPFVREPGDVVAVQEHPLALPCQVEGKPPVSITWQRDGLVLADDSAATLMPDGSLHLAALPSCWSLPSHAHEYPCMAQHRYGQLVSRRVQVLLSVVSKRWQRREPGPWGTAAGGSAQAGSVGAQAAPPPHALRVTLLPGSILHVTGVSQADVGIYRCVACNVASTRHSQDAQLTLRAHSLVEKEKLWEPSWGCSGTPPRLLQEQEILSGPQNLTLTVHQTAVLECIAPGHPRPLVSWSRLGGHSIGVEGIQVLGTGNLLISDVSVQHSGVYVCAANRPGTRVGRTAQGVLLVQAHFERSLVAQPGTAARAGRINHPAAPEFVQWPQSLSKPPDSSSIFTCLAQGVPEPRLVWLKNGKVLSPGDKMLAGVSAEDEAIYQCVAGNSTGSSQGSAHLAVTGGPEPPLSPRGLQAKALSTPAIQVSWEPSPSSGDIICYVLHLRPVGEPAGLELQEAVSRGTFEHVFSSLEPATAYSIHLRAYSAEGASEDSAPIHASTVGNTPAALGFSTRVLNATTVQASWELPPQPGPNQGFKLFHRKLLVAHFKGPLLLASSVSSFLYTDLVSWPRRPGPFMLCSLQSPLASTRSSCRRSTANGDGESSARFVSLRDVPPATPESKAGCSCSQDESSSLSGAVVGVHVGLAALIVCLLCLFLGWRHS